MEEPWIIFMEEFRERAEELAGPDALGEDDLLETLEATREAAADRLHLHLGLPPKESGRLTRALSGVVEEWARDGGADWDELGERLEVFHSEWDTEMGISRM